MTKEEVIEHLNTSFNGNSINGDSYIPLLSEFLTLEHPDKSSTFIQAIISNPLLIGQTISTIINYFTTKFEICYLSDSGGKILKFY